MREGRRTGRFLKKDSKLAKSVAIADFPFAEICETDVALMDNTKASILHVRLHDKEKMKTYVKQHETLDEPLIDRNKMPPVLQLKDFTKDWEKIRLRMRKGGGHAVEFDDDLFDENGDPIEHSSQSKYTPAATSSSITQETVEDKNKVEDTGVLKIKPDPANKSADSSEQESVGKIRTTLDESMQVVGKAIKELSVREHEPDESQNESAFIPMNPASTSSFNEQEVAAMEQYKQTAKGLEIIPPMDKEKVIAEAAAEGYKSGFEQGEQKAVQQVRERGQLLFSKLSELITELQGLKKQVLDNIQENFYELSQAIAEALLKREFQIDPKSYASVIKRAIAEAVGDDSFKIKLHPSTLELVSSVDVGDLKGRLVADKSLQEFEFKIESNLSVVSTTVQNLIRDLLEKAQPQLFNDEKAG